MRFGRLQVPSGRIGFVRDMYISCSGTLIQITSKLKKKLANLSYKKRFPKLVHGKVTRININFIVDYLHAFNIFFMNSWYAEEFYAPPLPPPRSQKRLGPPKEFLNK